MRLPSEGELNQLGLPVLTAHQVQRLDPALPDCLASALAINVHTVLLSITSQILKIEPCFRGDSQTKVTKALFCLTMKHHPINPKILEQFYPPEQIWILQTNWLQR